MKLFAGLVAFSVTVVAILPAIIIFAFHRTLRHQPVFIIHRQLLQSFLLASCMYIFNCLFFVIDGAPGDHLYFVNHISCRLLFTVQLRYLRLTTFAWMLGEGVYLYRLLMCTFAAGATESLRAYYLCCWGAPLLISAIYSTLRQLLDNEACWISPSRLWWIEWTIVGPCLVALSTNLLLMMVIFCVLLKKLRHAPNPEVESGQYIKAVRAVFMLVPVFGLHFLITIYRIQSHLHQLLNLVLDGLQGCFVAVIVCYTNRAVIQCVRTWLHQKADQRKFRRHNTADRLRFQQSSSGQTLMNKATLNEAIGALETANGNNSTLVSMDLPQSSSNRRFSSNRRCNLVKFGGGGDGDEPVEDGGTVKFT